ncbi:Trihelix transcription factor ASIL1 [Hirschfeldia incana]|nr:Trihelix transcription factor ASIL1 [Hirschfeldia incana]
MEEEDDTQSQQSPRDSLSPAPILPTSNVAANPPPSSSVSPLALVVHTPSVTVSVNRNGRSGGGGGGRDDCWSEEATKVLINAWGDRFSEPGKGTLKQQQWHEVAEIVNESGECKYTKTDVQCKNRIDTVKKKYKQEKAKMASGNGPSKWVFFKKLEALIGGVGGKKAPMVGARSGSGPMRWHFRKRSASETDSESDPEPEPEHSAESLPPPPLQPLPKRLKMDEAGGSGVGDLAKAILGFTEAYEKAETAKLKLMMELEKERMKFAKEMELQRMQFLKTQMEITQNNQEEERSKRDGGDDDDRNVKNNGDVSS